MGALPKWAEEADFGTSGASVTFALNHCQVPMQGMKIAWSNGRPEASKGILGHKWVAAAADGLAATEKPHISFVRNDAPHASQEYATMSELGRYIAAYYLPRAQADVVVRYEQLVRPPVSAEHVATMHLHMWKMALTDDTCDLQRVRASLLRRKLAPGDLEDIDDLVVRQLATLIGAYGADQKGALHMEVAMAFAAMNVTSAMSTAA